MHVITNNVKNDGNFTTKTHATHSELVLHNKRLTCPVG